MQLEFIPSSNSGEGLAAFQALLEHSLPSDAPGSLCQALLMSIIRMFLPYRLCGLGLCITPDALLHNLSPPTARGLTSFHALLPPSWILTYNHQASAACTASSESPSASGLLKNDLRCSRFRYHIKNRSPPFLSPPHSSSNPAFLHNFITSLAYLLPRRHVFSTSSF
jgi:hypothetical protein